MDLLRDFDSLDGPVFTNLSRADPLVRLALGARGPPARRIHVAGAH